MSRDRQSHMYPMGVFPVRKKIACCKCDEAAERHAVWLLRGEPIVLSVCLDHLDAVMKFQGCHAVNISADGVWTIVGDDFELEPEPVKVWQPILWQESAIERPRFDSRDWEQCSLLGPSQDEIATMRAQQRESIKREREARLREPGWEQCSLWGT